MGEVVRIGPDSMIWECPKCGHRVTDIEKQMARFDHPCRCHLTTLSDYFPVAIYFHPAKEPGDG